MVIRLDLPLVLLVAGSTASINIDSDLGPGTLALVDLDQDIGLVAGVNGEDLRPLDSLFSKFL